MVMSALSADAALTGRLASWASTWRELQYAFPKSHVFSMHSDSLVGNFKAHTLTLLSGPSGDCPCRQSFLHPYVPGSLQEPPS
jgi:hypothetical protein